MKQGGLAVPVVDASFKEKRLWDLQAMDEDVWEDAKLGDVMAWLDVRR